MYIATADELDNLTDDELWSVAADNANEAELRHEAIRRWLFPEGGDSDTADDNSMRLAQLRERASRIEPDELEEDDIEDFDHQGPYFDGEGNLIVEVDGEQYRIDDASGQSSMHLT